MTDSKDFISLTTDNATGICTLTMQRKPVNGMSPDFLSRLLSAFEACEKDTVVKAVLVRSAHASTFSAGLDLFEITGWLEANKGKMDANNAGLVPLIGDALSSPLRLSKPVAAAVAGHAIAGGFVLAAACDFVAVQKPKAGAKESLIGVTETQARLSVDSFLTAALTGWHSVAACAA